MWEMLYQAIYVPAGEPRLPREILQAPAVAHYLTSWGQPHDFGYIAFDANVAPEKPIGAGWIRCFTHADPGYGYIDDDTPELALLAVDEAYRQRGIGTQLLEKLLAYADERYVALSLSCDPRNPALHLYERAGFLVTGWCGTSYTLLRTYSMVSINSYALLSNP
jgi:ribosomal protein S18 acetylase RimI-like enzyme